MIIWILILFSDEAGEERLGTISNSACAKAHVNVNNQKSNINKQIKAKNHFKFWRI